MKKNLLSLMLIFAISSIAFSQTIKSNATKIEEFIPSGWKMFYKVSGDLNNDAKPDVILIIQKQDKNKVFYDDETGITMNSNPKILLIILKETSGYKISLRNDSFIMVHNDASMGEPFQEAKINKGAVTFNFQFFYNAGGETTTYSIPKFKFLNNEFKMVEYETGTFSRGTGEAYEYKVNLLTNKLTTKQSNLFDESIKPKIGYKNANVKTPILLSTLKDPFSWYN